MSEYTDSVESGLKGLAAVSTGPCPSCDECRETAGYVPSQSFAYGDGPEGDGIWIIEADERSATTQSEQFGNEADCLAACLVAFWVAWESGMIPDEGSFSHSGCGICNSHLGGDRYDWHYIDGDGEIQHESDACADCVMYLANGTEPEALAEARSAVGE